MKYRIRIVTVILFLLQFNLLAANPEKDDSNVVYQTEKGFIKLQVCSDNIIRVVVSPVKSLKERESLMVITYPDQKAKWIMHETERYISVETKKLIATIDKSNNTVLFYDKSGNLLLEGDGQSFEPETIDSESIFHITQNFKLSPVEAIYGLGQFQKGIMNYRGHDVTLFQENTVAVVPMLVSTKNYGILWDNYSLTKFHDGKEGTSFESKVADAIDYYFIAGSNLDDVIAGYRFLTGKAPMFGKWAYGYWQSKERYNNQKEIVDVVKEYRKRKLPLDNIVQDWMYWGDLGWSALEFDQKKFPDPKGMIDTIHKNNAHIMISIWPNFGTETDVFKEMSSKGFLIQTKDESRGLYDAYNKSARDLYWKWINKSFFSIGMDAWWMDATEPEVPGNTIADQAGKIGSWNNSMGSMARYLLPFSLMTTKGVYENQRKVTDKKRVYILTRSAYGGQQRYGAVTWSGDIHAEWDVFRNQISAGLNFCMAGIPYWTTDIGAFLPDNPLGDRDNAYREMYLRWFQFGVFNPMFRSHGSGTAREIWNFGGKNSWTYKPLQKFDNLRYRLLPYIYSMAWQVTNNAYTMMRGLPFDFDTDPNVYNIDNEYMFGPAFLVRPVTEKMYYEKNYLGDVIGKANLFNKKGEQGGLTTEFYNGINFDTLVTTDTKDKIDFDWNDGVSRPKGVHQYNYSIRFSGEIETDEEGKYTFLTTSNDGIRVTIDGKVIIENWTPHGATVDVGEISLKANKKYKIQVDYFQTLGGAITKLAWIKPGVAANLKEKKMPPVKSVQVYLPKTSSWIDFWRGNSFKGGQTILVPAPIDQIPLLIKAGSIIPMGPYLQYAEEKPADPIELRVYPGADAKFVLYEDENDNYNYEKGIYATIQFNWNEKDQTLTIGKREGEFPGMLAKRTFRIVWVSKGHGVGMEPEEKCDKIVRYSGERIIVRK
ncbi:MAG: glycoside hydrolase family 31 protein [Bacteroidota bacterium]|nr:glycoside hydrolase family 31 protein [Bacteroidota bacterium]